MPRSSKPTTKGSAPAHNNAAPALKNAAKKAKKSAVAKKEVSAPTECSDTASHEVAAVPTETVSASTDAAPVPVDSASKAVVGLQDDFTAFLAKLQQAVSLCSTLRTEFRSLERRSMRELRAAERITQKRKRKTGNRSPSGFVKPALISDELANFLSKPLGSQMARTEVTREINAYIRQHNLQDKDNGRQINADKKLSTLLSLSSSDTLTYFNLQRYMSRHFPKSAAKKAEELAKA